MCRIGYFSYHDVKRIGIYIEMRLIRTHIIIIVLLLLLLLLIIIIIIIKFDELSCTCYHQSISFLYSQCLTV